MSDSDIILRVLDLAEISSHHCQGVVNFPLALGGAAVLYSSPVAVVDEENRRIGFAAVTQDSHGLVEAEVFLSKDSPERLDLEQRLHQLFLWAKGITNWAESGGQLVSFHLESLLLTRAKAATAQPVW